MQREDEEYDLQSIITPLTARSLSKTPQAFQSRLFSSNFNASRELFEPTPLDDEKYPNLRSFPQQSVEFSDYVQKKLFEVPLEFESDQEQKDASKDEENDVLVSEEQEVNARCLPSNDPLKTLCLLYLIGSIVITVTGRGVVFVLQGIIGAIFSIEGYHGVANYDKHSIQRVTHSSFQLNLILRTSLLSLSNS